MGFEFFLESGYSLEEIGMPWSENNYLKKVPFDDVYQYTYTSDGYPLEQQYGSEKAVFTYYN